MSGWEGFDDKWLAKHNAKIQNQNTRNRNKSSGDKLQEPEKVVHHKSRTKSKDGRDNSGVKTTVLVHFRFNDNRKRDIDGSCNTIFDALVQAGHLAGDEYEFVQREAAGATKSTTNGCDIIIIDIIE